MNNLNIFKKLLAILLKIISLIACQKNEQGPKIPQNTQVYRPEVTLLTVESGMEQSFSVTADALAYQSSEITSEFRGTANAIYVKEGDRVRQGQNLIKISSPSINTAFRNAQNRLQNAQVQLKNTQLSANQSVRVAETSLNTARANLKNILNQNITMKKRAEETLSASRIKIDLAIFSAEIELRNAIGDVKPAIQNAFNVINKIMGITEAYKYIDTDAKKQLGVALVNSRKQAEDSILNLEKRLTKDVFNAEEAIDLLRSTEDAIDKTLIVLNNSAISADYTQAELIADINMVTPLLTTIRNKISAINAKSAALKSARQESENGSQTLIQAEADYKNTISKLEADEINARNAIESAEANLENAKKSAKLSEISAQGNLTNLNGQFNQAAVDQEKLIIKAPFSGKIREIKIKTGQEVKPGQTMIIVEDNSILKIISYLSEKDVEKLQVGDLAQINNVNEVAMIYSISSSADPINRKYKVELRYNGELIKAGSSVEVIFSSNQSSISSKIYLPLTSLHILPEEIFVWMLKDKKTIKRTVEIGEIIGNFAEIKSGLKKGEKIIDQGGRLIEEEGVEVMEKSTNN